MSRYSAATMQICVDPYVTHCMTARTMASLIQRQAPKCKAEGFWGPWDSKSTVGHSIRGKRNITWLRASERQVLVQHSGCPSRQHSSVLVYTQKLRAKDRGWSDEMKVFWRSAVHRKTLSRMNENFIAQAMGKVAANSEQCRLTLNFARRRAGGLALSTVGRLRSQGVSTIAITHTGRLAFGCAQDNFGDVHYRLPAVVMKVVCVKGFVI
ncbi:hypothetical protein B0H13DRAFT_1863823 [Mycena leptocephala]|nr:hypothetical protein B0H13DRAFT_1863823 [Mycena leptocephala]